MGLRVGEHVAVDRIMDKCRGLGGAGGAEAADRRLARRRAQQRAERIAGESAVRALRGPHFL